MRREPITIWALRPSAPQPTTPKPFASGGAVKTQLFYRPVDLNRLSILRVDVEHVMRVRRPRERLTAERSNKPSLYMCRRGYASRNGAGRTRQRVPVATMKKIERVPNEFQYLPLSQVSLVRVW